MKVESWAMRSFIDRTACSTLSGGAFLALSTYSA